MMLLYSSFSITITKTWEKAGTPGGGGGDVGREEAECVAVAGAAAGAVAAGAADRLGLGIRAKAVSCARCSVCWAAKSLLASASSTRCLVTEHADYVLDLLL